MCKVSVLVPIYNVERYLRQCLDSVVNQTLKDIEIICINDGSTDSSPDIIREYAEKDSRIRVIDKENTGYGHSMNCGLKLAQGEYIGIVESDDFAELNMFETLYNTAKEVDAEIVKSNWFKQIGNEAIPVKRNHNSYGQIFSPRIQNPNIFYGGIAIWSAIYKRIFLQKNNIYFNETPGASYQDVSFFFKTLACSENIVLTKDAFIHYRCDNPSSSVKSKEKVNCIFDEFKEIERFLQNRTDIKNTCEYIVEQFKYGCYLFNYNRIDDIFKFEFFERMANEFMQDNANGYIDKRYWSENNWNDIQTLLNNKKEFFYKKYEQTQNK
ncbi:MAG: glycosyltransferase, partial [Selenomonadaceae bacterium]|nr:glycosyltransferase [Selenomonadaceae bacterium]